MKNFLCELLFSCALLGPVAQPAEDLAYGTVLYEYYQEDYQGALLNALVAEERHLTGDESSAIRFDLAAGSFAFADGMYSYASDIFGSVPEEELTDIDRMRLAFHLAQEFHRRQDWPALDEQLGKIDLGKTWLRRQQKTHPYVEYMKADLALQQMRYGDALAHFDLMGQEHPLYAYGLFNLGVAYRESGDLVNASETFRTLAESDPYSEEALDLQQRARLAMALISRQLQQNASAETVLSELPSRGRYQEVAMAAYGGLAMDNEDYELAARIWMTLQQDSFWTPSTATARLGFPMSLEKLALDGSTTTEMALQQYRLAEASFNTRLGDLKTLSDEASDPAWVHDLLEVFAAEQQDEERMQELMRSWQEQLGHTDWLEWLSQDGVHQALQQWRELNGMEAWLENLPQRLEALEGVAGEQERRGEEARRLLHDDGLLQRRQELANELDRVSGELGSITGMLPEPSNRWMLPIATASERETLLELTQMETLIASMDPEDRTRYQTRIDRLRGVFFFRLVSERATRVQALRKEMKTLTALVDEVDERTARVAAAQHEFVTSVGTQFQNFLSRAEDITAQVETARLNRENRLAGEIRARMQEEMRRVEQYLLVTRIAIARATDQLALAAVQADEVQQ